jgi:ribosomal protein S18 acetylase RimI-like enzyme
MKAKIRPMRRRDKPAIMKLLAATPEFKPSEVAVAEELIDGYLKSPSLSGYYVLVAEVRPLLVSLLVGYVCYGPTPLTRGTWDIYWLAVSQKKQSRGIGGALLASVEAEIKKARGRLVLIETSSTPKYERTRRFYRRCGYEAACRLADFYAPGDDKVVFQKVLV